MATKVIQTQIPRAGSAKWSRPRPMTVVHPMSQQSLDLDLTITGTPTPGLEQEPSRIVRWPPEHLQRPNKQKPRVSKSTAWRTDNELFEQVKGKLTTGYEGVRQMFRAKDPYGDLIVTREGLFLIVKSLVGHISRDQYDSFLKSISLHWRSSISFDEFIVRFQDNPAVAMHLIYDLSVKHQKQNNLEKNLRNQDMLEWCPFTSAPHAYVVFRRKLHQGEADIHDLLPAICFNNDGRVIMPQLREALALVGLRLTDAEFDHIWLKFDPDNNGSVPIKRIYKMLNLSPNGLPKADPRDTKSACSQQRTSAQPKESEQKRCKTEMQMRTNTRKNTSVSKVESVEICGHKAEIIGVGEEKTKAKLPKSPQKVTTEVTTTTKEDKTTTVTTTTTTTKTTTEKMEEQIVDDSRLSSHVRALIKAKKSPPQFDSVIDHLHYKAAESAHRKFEETCHNLHSAFRLFDFMNDGYIARIDFRRVLKEFGFDIPAIDLDTFLIRAGVSVIQGLINYTQFLQKFQSKGDHSILSRTIVQNGESLRQSNKHIETDEAVRSEKMVENVAKFVHSNYLRLLLLLKQKDKNNTGVVPAHELRTAVNSVLKIKMSDKQFDELIQRLSEKSNNGSPQIDYGSFLNLFNIEPGQWNKHKDGFNVGQKYQLGEIMPATPVLRLLEKSKTWMASPAERDAKSNSRVAEIKKELSKLFTDRFHIFDKSFQDMDRKRTGYMSKWQFGAVIKLCGITLTISDLDHLWSSLDTAADNTLGYATLVKAFCPGQHQQKHSSAEKPSTAKIHQKSAGIERQKKATSAMTVEQPQVTTGSVKDRRLTELLKKVEHDVMRRWDVLYSIFLSLDGDGYSSISVQDMRDIFYKLKLPLTSAERDELCIFFDINGNGWFHYLSFLNAVKKLSPSQEVNPCVFNIHTKRLHKVAGPTSMAVTVYDFLLELKGMLLKKFKTVRGSFKFFDHNHDGFIEEDELRKSLTSLGYSLSNQDFLDILQLFDRSQGQKLSYEDFKTTLLTV